MKRYDINEYNDSERGTWFDFEEDEVGEWVRFREIATLRAETDALKDMLREGVDISKPRVRQLDMAVWRQDVRNLLHRSK